MGAIRTDAAASHRAAGTLSAKKTSMKKKLVLIPENVYRQPVWLCIGHEWESPAFQRFLTKEIEVPAKEEARMRPSGRTAAKWVINEDNHKSFIWLNPKINAVIPILIHEIAHLCISTLESRGVPITEDGSEAFTHLMEYYSNEAFYHLGMGKMTWYGKS